MHLNRRYQGKKGNEIDQGNFIRCCRLPHLHSHQQGGEKVVAKAIIAWIKTKKVETLIRE